MASAIIVSFVVVLYLFLAQRLIRAERALRELLSAFEASDNVERLHAAIQAARKVCW